MRHPLHRRLLARIYQPQVKFAFTPAVLEAWNARLGDPPAGYVIRSPRGPEDYQGWADLLNQDGQFGHWTPERIRDDIVAHLVAPDAATLIEHGGRLVGCSSTADVSTGRRREMIGMFLYLVPEHRARGRLSEHLVCRTMLFGARERYDRLIASTDPWRYPALALYLRIGATPVTDSLYSHAQWARIRWRLRKVLSRDRARGKKRTATAVT